ncbi:MAG: MaoC family dehydratase N-terminal domain-containing protein [Thermodesulfobacteriota bacterium]|nr:MaoC family dehydratase N-terminal domain-containing protein [Thermodesulfobacteriota bacterium]
MLDKSKIGKEYPEIRFEVEKGKIREFARAIGDKSPVYYDEEAAKEEGYEGLVMPPTFPTTFTAFSITGGGLFRIIDDLKIDLIKVLHGGQEYEYVKPIKPGDTVTGKTKILDMFEKSGKGGTMDFLVLETTYSNQDGEKVLIDRSTVIIRN